MHETVVTLSDKFWAYFEPRFPTAACVLRERGITTAVLLRHADPNRYSLLFRGAPACEAPEFFRLAGLEDGSIDFDGKPEDLELRP